MPEKFKQKYTIKLARLQNYDYSQNGMYFVTICAKDRERFFGEIENGKMILSDTGKITQQFWQEIPKHFSFVNLDEYIVMPNHIHGILEIINGIFVETPFMASWGLPDAEKISQNAKYHQDAGNIQNVKYPQGTAYPQNTGYSQNEGYPQGKGNPRDAINRVSTEDNKKRGGITGENNPMLNPNSLSKIIRWYKGRCTFEIKKQFNPILFAWQSRYYDHIHPVK